MIYLGEVGEVGLENVLHVRWINSVGVHDAWQDDTERLEAFEEVGEEPVVHGVEVGSDLHAGSHHGPLLWFQPTPLLPPVHP